MVEMKIIIYSFVAFVVFIAVYRTTVRVGDAPPAQAVAVPAGYAAVAAAPACSVSSIKIKSLKAGFIDRCRRQVCYQMQGVAVLTNGCDDAIGVQVKIVALDKADSPVASHDFWPASISNIPPGDYTFSLDHLVAYDSRIKSFTLQPIRVERWRAR